MPYLTTTDQIAVALIVALALGLLLYLNWRGQRREETILTLHGPAMPPEFEQMFGPYGGGGVVGVIVLQEGIRVGYRDGHSLLFPPLPQDGFLYVNKDGEFVVGHPGDDVQ